jgi:hypothetical protein
MKDASAFGGTNMKLMEEAGRLPSGIDAETVPANLNLFVILWPPGMQMQKG